MNRSVAGSPWLPSRDYADRDHARLHVVYPAVEQMPSAPEFAGSLRVDMLRYLDPHTPDLGILELSRPLVYGKHGWIFSHDGVLLPEHSWHGRDVERMRLPDHLPKGTPLPGTSLSLASDFAGRSYGHYLLDSLSRMHLFLAAGFTLDAVDHVLCHQPPTAEAAQHFSRLGVPPEKCVWVAGGAAWMPERLLAPSFPGTKMNYPAWVPAYLRQACGPAPSTTRRRLWIGRTGRRRGITNAAEVDRVMQELGFEAYDVTAAANPADDFAAVAMVVSPHGGALADLVFCSPGTRVLELVPTDHPAPYYYTLSLAAELEYRCLACRSLSERPEGARTPSIFDLTVDIGDLSAAIAGMESYGMPWYQCVAALANSSGLRTGGRRRDGSSAGWRADRRRRAGTAARGAYDTRGLFSPPARVRPTRIFLKNAHKFADRMQLGGTPTRRKTPKAAADTAAIRNTPAKQTAPSRAAGKPRPTGRANPKPPCQPSETGWSYKASRGDPGRAFPNEAAPSRNARENRWSLPVPLPVPDLVRRGCGAGAIGVSA